MNKKTGKTRRGYEMAAKFLGCFSIGLGLTELLAPRQFAKFIGIEDKHRDLLRGMGLREIASGIGILTHRDPATWLQARVGGDLLDLALLGLAFKTDTVQTGRLFAVISSVAGVTAADMVCSKKLTRQLGEAEA